MDVVFAFNQLEPLPELRFREYLNIAMLDCLFSLLETVSGFQGPSGEHAQDNMINSPVSSGYFTYEIYSVCQNNVPFGQPRTQ